MALPSSDTKICRLRTSRSLERVMRRRAGCGCSADPAEVVSVTPPVYRTYPRIIIPANPSTAMIIVTTNHSTMDATTTMTV